MVVSKKNEFHSLVFIGNIIKKINTNIEVMSLSMISFNSNNILCADYDCVPHLPCFSSFQEFSLNI